MAADSIGEALGRGVAQRGIPAAAAAAGSAHGTLYEGAFGTRDAESGRAVTADSIFAIASMTKALTSAAAMQLAEQGRIALDEPAREYLAELGQLPVLEGFDGAGRARLRPARKPVTTRQLLTHTSGFVYDTWHEEMLRYTRGGGDMRQVLAFEPGERWHYGPGTYWVGRLVEAVSGTDLESYLRRHVLGPLGMSDTSFILPPEKYDRLVGRYQREADGRLTPVARGMPPRPESYRGDGGMYSTAADYLKFTQMILRRGAGPGGERILKEETVALMTANGTGRMAAGRLRTANGARSGDLNLNPDGEDRYTPAFLLNVRGVPGGRAAGSLFWAGIYNTYYWIDPASEVCGVLLMGFLPFADREALGLLDDFQRAVYAVRRTGLK